MHVQWESKGFQDYPSRKLNRIMSSSEELSQRPEKRFHCACDFHASSNFSVVREILQEVCQVFCANARTTCTQVIEASKPR